MKTWKTTVLRKKISNLRFDLSLTWCLSALRSASVGVLLALTLYAHSAFSQGVAINNNNDAPDPSAILDVQSTSKGMLVPRMDSLQRTMIASPATGLLVFETTCNCFQFYDGSDWMALVGNAGNEIADADNDTKVQVEESADEDRIRFDVAGSQAMIINNNGMVGIGRFGPIAPLEIATNNAATESTITSFFSQSNRALHLLSPDVSNNNDPFTLQTFNAFQFRVDGIDALNIDHIGRVGIGTTNPNEQLEVIGAIRMVDGNEGPGQVMMSDSNGTASWSNMDVLQDADKDTRIQVEESADEDIIRIDLEGTEHYVLDNGRIHIKGTGSSTFLGDYAGINDDLSINSNTFIGNRSGERNTSGSQNTALGSSALRDNIESHQNTAVGYFALRFYTVGIGNTATGWRSMYYADTASNNSTLGKATLRDLRNGNDNTAIGANAGQSMFYGSENTLVGKESGQNTNGNGNTFLGFRSGENNTSGSGNVFVGRYSGGNSGSRSDQLYIDNSSTNTPLIWGDFSNDTIKIYGSLGIKDAFHFPDVDGTSGQILQTNGAGDLSWATITDTDDQMLSISNDTLIIVDGNAVDLSKYLDDTDTDDQTLSISNDTLIIVDGNAVDLSKYLDDTDTDDQTLTISNDTLIIADGNAVDLSKYLDDTDTDDQTLSISNDTLIITDGNAVDLSKYLDDTDTDDQTLSISNDTLIIVDGNAVDLSKYLDDTDTDDQTLTISNDTLFIADGNAVDLSKYLDNTDTDDQTLSISNDTLIIADGNAVDISRYLDDTDTDDQTLAISNDTLIIADGNSVDLSGYKNDTLSFIQDSDSDTKIQVEEITDEDRIRFDVAGSQAMIITNNGMVGIGRNNPNAPLQIQTSDTTTETTIATFYSQTGRPLSILSPDISDNNDAFTFQTNNSYGFRVDGTDAFSIDQSGNIGVRTTAPNEALEVNGSIRMTDGNQAPGYLMVSDANGTATWTDAKSIKTDTLSLIQDADGDTKIQVEESNDEDVIRFDAAGNEIMHLQQARLQMTDASQALSIRMDEANGYIQLDVGGSGHSSDKIYLGDITNSGNEVIINGNLGLGTSNPVDDVAFGGDEDATLIMERTTVDDGHDITLQAGGALAGTFDEGGGDLILSGGIATGDNFKSGATHGSNIIFKTATPTGSSSNADVLPDEKMRIAANGNVGIDVSNPSYKLEVGGNTHVQGTLTADKVDLTSQVVWDEARGTNAFTSNPTAWNQFAATGSLSVTNGDVIRMDASMLVRLTQGSGTDDFYFKVEMVGSGGCATSDASVFGPYRPAEGSSTHDNFFPVSYLDMHTVNCNGSYTFRLLGQNTGDDDWEERDSILVVTKL